MSNDDNIFILGNSHSRVSVFRLFCVSVNTCSAMPSIYATVSRAWGICVTETVTDKDLTINRFWAHRLYIVQLVSHADPPFRSRSH